MKRISALIMTVLISISLILPVSAGSVATSRRDIIQLEELAASRIIYLNSNSSASYTFNPLISGITYITPDMIFASTSFGSAILSPEDLTVQHLTLFSTSDEFSSTMIADDKVILITAAISALEYDTSDELLLQFTESKHPLSKSYEIYKLLFQALKSCAESAGNTEMLAYSGNYDYYASSTKETVSPMKPGMSIYAEAR